MHSLDSQTPPIPFNNQAYHDTLKKKLIIGYFDELPILPVTRSVKNAIAIAKEALKA
jgi:hypothetical protein